MNPLRHSNRGLALPLLMIQLAVSSPANSAELKLPREGWVSWQVAAFERAPAWCCWSMGRDRDASPASCQLDGGHDGYGVGGNDGTTDAVKVYARLADGKVDRLQVLSATCPVETKTTIHELGSVAADDSARWLIVQAKHVRADAVPYHSIAERALAALAMHSGGVARDALAGFTRDPRRETRKSAVFWLAMLRGAEGADITSAVMFNDQDAQVRQHAAFAMAQTRTPRATQDLIRQGNTDKVDEVRAQAWFWLAQSGAAEAEQAIGQALTKDADGQVRERAIFALSQLPEDRAARALIAAAEDQSLSRQQRKRALFWLSQSEADSAQAYLEKVFARNTDGGVRR